jgi:hypothetical protein
VKNAARLELERILDAIAVLSRTKSNDSKPTEKFLRLLVQQFNELQLTVGMSDTMIAEGLSNFLKKHDYSQGVWWGLSYYRSNLFEWSLAHDVREKLKPILEKNRSFLHNIGNFFIMFISVLQYSRGYSFTLSELCTLWDSIRPWILMQLGAIQSEKDQPLSRFNIQKIFESLKARVACWDNTPSSSIPSFNSIRYGITLDSIEPQHPDADRVPAYRWYIFERSPYSKELIAGCIRIHGNKLDRRTLIPLDEQAEQAEK